MEESEEVAIFKYYQYSRDRNELLKEFLSLENAYLSIGKY